MALQTITTAIDFDLELQAVDEEGRLIDLSESDILHYGAILFQADGTVIGQYSTNGTALAGLWENSAKIEEVDLPNGIFKLHVDKEKTQGLISQNVTARIMIQSDATIDLDDKHVDNEIWLAGEAEVFALDASLDDSIITMT